jgi:hypothetical protein
LWTFGPDGTDLSVCFADFRPLYKGPVRLIGGLFWPTKLTTKFSRKKKQNQRKALPHILEKGLIFSEKKEIIGGGFGGWGFGGEGGVLRWDLDEKLCFVGKDSSWDFRLQCTYYTAQ